MNSLRDIRRRIRSIGNTAQITRAMQMVASSKMRKAQDNAIAGRPFARLLYRIQREAAHSTEFEHPLMEIREVRKRAVILIGADKGLCGALNSNLFRVAAEYDPPSTVFITAGRKAAQFVAGTHRQLAAEFLYGDSPTFQQARAVATLARQLFLNREVDQVDIVTTRFVNTMTQEAGSIRFLPVGAIETVFQVPDLAIAKAFETAPPAEFGEFLFEPSAGEVLSSFLTPYLNFMIYLAMLNAKASEQSARMVAMKNATDNAEDLMRDLTLEYNKLRQGNITRELLDISGGQAE